MGRQFYYSVLIDDEKHEIITEWNDFSKFIVFRFNVAPGEVYGRGPVITALPTIRQLNKLHELILRSAQLQAYPIFMTLSSSGVNPYTTRILPGAMLAFGREDFLTGDPVRPLSTGNGVQIGQEFLQFLQQTIKDIMFANPLPAQSAPNQTATEITIRQQQWIQKNAGAFGRISVELMPQIIDKSLVILTKRGIIQPLKINNVTIPISGRSRLLKFVFESPLANIQNQNEVQTIEQAVQFALQTFGGVSPVAGLTTFNIGELPEEVYRKMNLPEKLINEGFKDSPVVNAVMQAVNTGQTPGQQGQQGQVPEEATQPAGDTSGQDESQIGLSALGVGIPGLGGN